MSILSEWFTDLYTTSRNAIPNPTTTSSVSVIGTGYGLLRPITDRNQLFDDNNWGKEYAFLVDEDADIKQGDTLSINNSTYGVSVKGRFDDLDDNSESHLELRIYKRD